MAVDASHTDEPTIPPRVRRMWRIDAPARKGPRPGLSREEIAVAAIAIADAEGLAAVSMGRVAHELGYTTMSLYRYVESKDELVALMWDTALGAPPNIDVSDGWRAALMRWAFLQRKSLRDHSWALDIPISTPPISPHQIDWMEAGLAALDGTPLRYADKLGVILAVSVAVLAEARLTLELAAGDQLSPNDYASLLTRLIGRDTHRHLRAAIDEGAFAFDTEEPDEDFAFTLGLTLDGVEKMIREQQSS